MRIYTLTAFGLELNGLVVDKVVGACMEIGYVSGPFELVFLFSWEDEVLEESYYIRHYIILSSYLIIFDILPRPYKFEWLERHQLDGHKPVNWAI